MLPLPGNAASAVVIGGIMPRDCAISITKKCVGTKRGGVHRIGPRNAIHEPTGGPVLSKDAIRISTRKICAASITLGSGARVQRTHRQTGNPRLVRLEIVHGPWPLSECVSLTICGSDVTTSTPIVRFVDSSYVRFQIVDGNTERLVFAPAITQRSTTNEGSRTMTAQEAKSKLLATIKEIYTEGFIVGGHWDDDVVLLVARRKPMETWGDFDENYDEIDSTDLEILYGE